MQTPPRIRLLLVEDSQSDAELFEIYLQQIRSADYQIQVADTLADGIAVMKSQPLDIVLVDLNLPDSFGIDTCRKLHAASPATPIIVLTGLADEQKALEAMQVGAQDYLVKGEINGSLLSRAIRYSIERQRAAEMQRQSNDRMRLITEQLPAVLWTTDVELRITPPSSNFLINEVGESLVGRTLHDFFETDDERYPPIAAHQRAVRGEPVSIEFFWRGRTLSVHVEPLRDAGGNIIGTIGISLDVSTQKRMQEELDAARHVQQALFPREAPNVPGFDIAGAVYAAKETAGDYFDFIPMENGCWGTVVGDVTGHGLGPALLMAELRAYLRAVATTRPHSGEILMLANRFLSGDLEEHRFVTLFLARIDPADRSFTFASAGHNGYLLRASGEIETLKSTGLPLGLIPDTIINTSFRVAFEPGDMLFVPTDGFQEAHTVDNELFSLSRTLQFAKDHRSLPGAQIIEELRTAVCEFVGSEDIADDMSAIIVRCLA
ncbi:MAG: SpoIIE family protein phosphatase [Rhodopirellula sp.]|nr:SpoIIE family protein phosphatase [Rhodopirellula sp.]